MFGMKPKYLPVETRYTATACAHLADGSIAQSQGAFAVFVGEACVFSANARQTLDGPIEMSVELDHNGKVLEILDGWQRIVEQTPNIPCGVLR